MKKAHGFGSGSGTQQLFAIESRCTWGPLVISADFTLDNHWRNVPLDPAIYGIHYKTWCPIEWDYLRLVNEEAAFALAHAFIANLHAASLAGAGCVEVRVVQVEVTYSYATKELGVSTIIHRTDGPRESFTPRETTDIPLSARQTATESKG